jgi:Ni,Fe-hydrogenase III small subunit
MLSWLGKGLETGIRSSSFPDRPEQAPGSSPGRPAATRMSEAEAAGLAAQCPTGALKGIGGGIGVDYRSCIHCLRCRREGPVVVDWEEGQEWGARAEAAKQADERFRKAFGRSLHVRFVDAGGCGACLSEARLLNNPYYNMHRLGIFVTATPRQADVLLVAGPMTDAMRKPLRETYEAMPEPKRVVAMGVCAISGGVFGQTFASLGGIAECIPVDVVVPGCPPPPLAILHGLLLAVERVPAASLESSGAEVRT